MGCRIDKFIWSVRLAKTRSKAAELITKNKVLLNNNRVKPSKEVVAGDQIQLIRHTSTYTYKIIDLLEKRVGAKLVTDFILDITPIEEVEKYKLYKSSQRSYRDLGAGKPTKKDRREIEKFIKKGGRL